MLLHPFNFVLATRTRTLKSTCSRENLGVEIFCCLAVSGFFITVTQMVEIIASATGFPQHGDAQFWRKASAVRLVGLAVTRRYAL
jgi:hypothetical protein